MCFHAQYVLDYVLQFCKSLCKLNLVKAKTANLCSFIPFFLLLLDFFGVKSVLHLCWIVHLSFDFVFKFLELLFHLHSSISNLHMYMLVHVIETYTFQTSSLVQLYSPFSLEIYIYLQSTYTLYFFRRVSAP